MKSVDESSRGDFGNGRPEFPKVIAIIPAFNESASVGSVVAAVRRAAPRAAVLVIDDGSSDGTAEVARAAGAAVIRLPFNLGIGGAVQTGLLYAFDHGYDVALQVDGDGQHPPEEIPRLIEALERTGADLVIGSRFIEDTGYRAPLARRIGIAVFARLLSILCGQRLTDTTSGFRAANRLALAHLSETYASDYPEVESLITLHRAGYRLAEVPVRMVPRTGGVSSISPARAAYYIIKVILAVLVDAVAKPTHTRDQVRAERQKEPT